MDESEPVFFLDFSVGFSAFFAEDEFVDVLVYFFVYLCAWNFVVEDKAVAFDLPSCREFAKKEF